MSCMSQILAPPGCVAQAIQCAVIQIDFLKHFLAYHRYFVYIKPISHPPKEIIIITWITIKTYTPNVFVVALPKSEKYDTSKSFQRLFSSVAVLKSSCLVCASSRRRYDIGATSSVLTQLISSTYSDVTWYTIVKDSTLLQGVITSSGVLGEGIQNVYPPLIMTSLFLLRAVVFRYNDVMYQALRGILYRVGRFKCSCFHQASRSSEDLFHEHSTSKKFFFSPVVFPHHY